MDFLPVIFSTFYRKDPGKATKIDGALKVGS
jgi:hypothetical protein